jgi:hypothetical protein
VIIIAFPTVMDGIVLRWYRDQTGAEIGDELMSVSREGVRVNCFQHEIPEQHMNTASEAYATLRDRAGDVGHLATHRWSRAVGRQQLVKIEKENAG